MAAGFVTMAAAGPWVGLRLAAGVSALVLLGGCAGSGAGSSTGAGSVARSSTAAGPSADARLPPDYVPVSVGSGPLYRPGPRPPRVRSARPVDGLRCDRRAGRRFGTHLELFAHQHVVAIPAGIGLAPPLVLAGPTVRRARCYYPAATIDPSGVIAVRAGSRSTLGELFDLWGQPLGRRRLAGFTAPGRAAVTSFLDGQRWRSDPRQIPLSGHGRITLELASHVLPHRVYLFPPGL